MDDRYTLQTMDLIIKDINVLLSKIPFAMYVLYFQNISFLIVGPLFIRMCREGFWSGLVQDLTAMESATQRNTSIQVSKQ
jgi:hypothetical protein